MDASPTGGCRMGDPTGVVLAPASRGPTLIGEGCSDGGAVPALLANGVPKESMGCELGPGASMGWPVDARDAALPGRLPCRVSTAAGCVLDLAMRCSSLGVGAPPALSAWTASMRNAPKDNIASSAVATCVGRRVDHQAQGPTREETSPQSYFSTLACITTHWVLPAWAGRPAA